LKYIEEGALQERSMAQASLLVIMPRGQFIAIAEVESEPSIFEGLKAGIKVCDPDNAVTPFDQIQ
jgi:hypothetical protein